MSVRRVDLSDVPPTPWANGRGTTREMLRHCSSDGALICRVAVADVVAPGPFSLLPGVDRTLVLIAGKGFDLRCGERLITVRALEPVSFSGDEPFEAESVAGPSRDLNVMSGRGIAETTVTIHRGSFTDTAGDLSCYFVAAGSFGASLTDGRPLSSGELLEVSGEPGRPIALAGAGAVVAIRVIRIDTSEAPAPASVPR
jgi:environmental stress-induced protein Ves